MADRVNLSLPQPEYINKQKQILQAKSSRGKPGGDWQASPNQCLLSEYQTLKWHFAKPSNAQEKAFTLPSAACQHGNP